MPTDTVIVFRG